MPRLFSAEFDSNRVRDDNEKLKYKKLLFVAYEGTVTEPKYFKAINQVVKSNKEYAVKLFPIDRPRKDGLSHPKHVRDGIIEYYKEKLLTIFNNDTDELWIIIDIDLHFDSKDITADENYRTFLESLIINEKIKIHAGISNPSFELWLLLHLVKPDDLSLDKIKKNERLSKKYSYIKKELKDLTPKSFGDYNNIYEYFFSRTSIAIKNSESKLLKNTNEEILNNVGTSVAELFKKIISKTT